MRIEQSDFAHVRWHVKRNLWLWTLFHGWSWLHQLHNSNSFYFFLQMKQWFTRNNFMYCNNQRNSNQNEKQISDAQIAFGNNFVSMCTCFCALVVAYHCVNSIEAIINSSIYYRLELTVFQDSFLQLAIYSIACRNRNRIAFIAKYREKTNHSKIINTKFPIRFEVLNGEYDMDDSINSIRHNKFRSLCHGCFYFPSVDYPCMFIVHLLVFSTNYTESWKYCTNLENQAKIQNIGKLSLS